MVHLSRRVATLLRREEPLGRSLHPHSLWAIRRTASKASPERGSTCTDSLGTSYRSPSIGWRGRLRHAHPSPTVRVDPDPKPRSPLGSVARAPSPFWEASRDPHELQCMSEHPADVHEEVVLVSNPAELGRRDTCLQLSEVSASSGSSLSSSSSWGSCGSHGALDRQKHPESESEGGIALSRFISFMFSLVYLIIGVIIAASHHYFEHLDALKPIASAVLAVLLWPLVLFGVNLHLK